MNGHNRRRKYRRSVYRRRNIGTVLISVALSVIAFIIFLLIVGNILHKKSISRHAGDGIGEESPPVSDIIQTSQKRPSSQLSGRLCLLRTNDSSVFSERLDALLGEECKHVSVPLNNPSDGSLLYLSEVGTSIGIATSSDGDLDGAVKSAKERGMTVSGIYYLHSLSIENPLVRSAELSRAAAVIAEILGKGVDEVSVVATDMTADHIGELIEFVSDIHSLTERGAIGITVSEDILTSENASALMSNEITIARTGIAANTAPPTCKTVFFLSFLSTDFATIGAFSIGAINVRISLNTPSRLSAMVLSVNEVVQITVDTNKTANAINLEI